MLTVHLRINDAATARPTPVRLRISGPDGAFYPPLGRFAEFATGKNEDVGGHLRVGREKWCYTDGSCEVPLPAGVPLRVQATKGPEYRPLDETVTLGPGQMALRFAVERWTDARAKGWYSGDTRCHFITPHSALLEAAAEDLDVVNLLACEQRLPSLDGTAYQTASNLTAFSGQSAALEAHGRLVAVNTLNAHPVLGRVGLLYSHRPVFPLSFGGDSDTDDWSLCDWCDQCHRKGGLTVWVDAFRPTGGLVGGEALVAAILGKIDAVEIDAHPRQQPLLPWIYRLWNAGFPIPLVGGSGKDSNTVALGAMRTYALLRDGAAFTYKEWIEAVHAGRTFATNGPLVSLEVGREARATVQNAVPFDRLELVSNEGVVQGATTVPHGLEAHIPGDKSLWLAARCRNADGSVFAHTSPAVVRVGDQPLPRQPEAVAALVRSVEATREWVENVGRFTIPKGKQNLLDRCSEALTKLGSGA